MRSLIDDNEGVIDLWHPDSFDDELTALLETTGDLLANYHLEDSRLLKESNESNPYHSPKSNHYYRDFCDFVEGVLKEAIYARTVRVWHYTRLLDYEVDSICSQISCSTLTTLSERLNAAASNGWLTPSDVKTIYAQSALHSQSRQRSGLFCATTVPINYESSLVSLLLENWGGEATYFHLRDKNIETKLKGIGEARILEVAIPMKQDQHALTSAYTVAAAWAKSGGLRHDVSGADIFLREGLDESKVLRVHSQSDPTFETIGKSYPLGCSLL